jgi:hypothetical protein
MLTFAWMLFGAGMWSFARRRVFGAGPLFVLALMAGMQSRVVAAVPSGMSEYYAVTIQGTIVAGTYIVQWDDGSGLWKANLSPNGVVAIVPAGTIDTVTLNGAATYSKVVFKWNNGGDDFNHWAPVDPTGIVGEYEIEGYDYVGAAGVSVAIESIGSIGPGYAVGILPVQFVFSAESPFFGDMVPDDFYPTVSGRSNLLNEMYPDGVNRVFSTAINQWLYVNGATAPDRYTWPVVVAQSFGSYAMASIQMVNAPYTVETRPVDQTGNPTVAVNGGVKMRKRLGTVRETWTFMFATDPRGALYCDVKSPRNTRRVYTRGGSTTGSMFSYDANGNPLGSFIQPDPMLNYGLDRGTGFYIAFLTTNLLVPGRDLSGASSGTAATQPTDMPTTQPIDEEMAGEMGKWFDDAIAKAGATTRPSFLPQGVTGGLVPAETESDAHTAFQRFWHHFGLSTLIMETPWCKLPFSGGHVFSSAELFSLPVSAATKARELLAGPVQAYVHFFTGLFIVFLTGRYVIYRCAWAVKIADAESVSNLPAGL